MAPGCCTKDSSDSMLGRFFLGHPTNLRQHSNPRPSIASANETGDGEQRRRGCGRRRARGAQRNRGEPARAAPGRPSKPRHGRLRHALTCRQPDPGGKQAHIRSRVVPLSSLSSPRPMFSINRVLSKADVLNKPRGLRLTSVLFLGEPRSRSFQRLVAWIQQKPPVAEKVGLKNAYTSGGGGTQKRLRYMRGACSKEAGACCKMAQVAVHRSELGDVGYEG